MEPAQRFLNPSSRITPPPAAYPRFPPSTPVHSIHTIHTSSCKACPSRLTRWRTVPPPDWKQPMSGGKKVPLPQKRGMRCSAYRIPLRKQCLPPPGHVQSTGIPPYLIPLPSFPLHLCRDSAEKLFVSQGSKLLFTPLSEEAVIHRFIEYWPWCCHATV